MLNPEEILNRLNTIVGGFKYVSDNIFKNNYYPEYIKKGAMTVPEEAENHLRRKIFCNIQGCECFFQSNFSYESHYNSQHRYRCSECKKSLPTPHLLDLHFSENHDAYFAVLSLKKPMYSCFLEECHHKSKSAEERKDHCISVHSFPRDFRFDKIGSKHNSAPKYTIIDESMDGEKDHPVKTKSNFSFGHAKGKTFNKASYSSIQNKSVAESKNSLEDSKMITDLLSSLPE